MRALLVGCGAMAEGWSQAIHNNAILAGRVTIVGLVDANEAIAQGFSATQGLTEVPIFTDINTALKSLDVDVVFDVTPPNIRPQIVRAALAAGAHVLSEKPMAPSLEEARALAKIAQDAGRTYAVTQNRRYSAGIRRIGQFLRTKAIGEVTGLHADFFIGARFGGFRDHMQNVLLLDMAVHHFDAARYLSGQAPQAAYCVETNPTGSWYDHGAAAAATFEMSNNVLFSYRGSWCAEGAQTAWDARWRITGSLGTLMWDGEGNIEARIGVGEPVFLRETELLHVPTLKDDYQAQGHASVIAEFLDAITAGRAPETDSTDNLHTIAMVFAAIESAKTGQRIPINIEQIST